MGRHYHRPRCGEWGLAVFLGDYTDLPAIGTPSDLDAVGLRFVFQIALFDGLPTELETLDLKLEWRPVGGSWTGPE